MSISLAIATLMTTTSVDAAAHSSILDAQLIADYSDDQENEERAGASDQPAPSDADERKDGEIVVTGSRIATDGTRAPTPVTVMSADSLQTNSPLGIAEALNQLPVFQGAINAQMTQLTTSNRVRAGNYMNLRYLGPARVLVLQDGYRLPPSGNNGGVDTNIIPQMLIERVEVVTGGASAVYGSDAVSGVVNYITDKRFTGIKTLAQTGVSKYGDAFSYRIGAAAGASLGDDRLNLQFSAEHYYNEGIPRQSSRRVGELWITGAEDPTLQSGLPGSANNPYLDYPNVTRNTVSLGGLITAGPTGLRNLQFLPSGSLGTFNLGTPIGRPGYGQGSDGPPICLECTLVPASETTQLFGRATYEFSPNLEGFLRASFNSDSNSGENLSLIDMNIPIFADNYFLQNQLTPEQRALLGDSRLTVSRKFGEWDTAASRLGAVASNQNLKSIVLTTGLEGSLFGDWKWDTAFTYGVTDFRSVTKDEIRSDRFLAAIDTVDDGNGNPVCRVTLVSDRFADCMPLNVLGVGRADPAAIRWVFGDSKWRVRNYLYSGALNFAGTLFSNWAGPISLAVGVEYRKQKIKQTSNSDPEHPVDFTGIRGGSGGTFRLTNVGTADGQYNVKEFYAETAIPLIRDARFTNSLDINAAFRHTDYSTSGGVDTYKAGMTWEPIDDIKFRGAISRDIRAPSLIELFGGVTIQERPVFDPITNALHTVRNPSGGNPLLKPEKADTITVGTVLTPTFLPGFYGSIDYFDIKIKDAIGTPGTIFQIFDACTANTSSPLCDLIIRDANNVPIQISGKNENVSVLRTKGIDFEFGYRTALGNGDLSVRALGTRLISYKRQATDAVPIVEYVGTADLPGLLTSTYPLPKWRGNLNVNFSNDSFSVGIQERMIGSYVKSGGIQHYVFNHINPVFYTDINFAKNVNFFGGESQFFFNVNNLFNKEGPFFITDQNNQQPPTARTLYDIVGRYATIGIRSRF